MILHPTGQQACPITPIASQGEVAWAFPWADLLVIWEALLQKFAVVLVDEVWE